MHNIALDVIDDSAHRTIEVRLLQFDIDDVRDSGPLFVEGKGTLSGNEFQIEGQLGALPKIFNGAEPYPVTLAIHTAGLRVSVSGTVQDFLEGEGLALRLSGQADDLSNLFKLLKIEAPPLGELKFEALVTRDMTAPRVSALSVGLSGDTSLEFTARGAIDNAISAAGANIQFDGSCADPRVFAWLLPEVRPQPKSIQLTGELRESSGVLAAERLKLVIGDEQTAALKVTGRIASVLKAADALADGIDLMAEARDIPLPTVSDLFGLMLPDLGPINGRFKIAGSPAQLAVSKARLTTVSAQGLNISATGGISHIRLGSQKPLAGIDFSLTATAPHWAALPGAASLDLPDMGPVQIKGAVNDSSGRLDVESFEIRCETNQQAPLRLQGQILGIGSLEQMALQAAVETGSQPWVAKYLNRPSAASVPIKGSIKLAGDADGLRIDDIRFETSAGEGLAIKARGRLMRLFKSPTVELDLDISAPDPAAIASMAGVSLPPLGPLAIKGRFNSNTQKIGFSGKSTWAALPLNARSAPLFMAHGPA